MRRLVRVRRVIVCRAAWLHGCSQPISAVIEAMTPRKLSAASLCGRARAMQGPGPKSQIDMPLRLFAPFRFALAPADSELCPWGGRARTNMRKGGKPSVSVCRPQASAAMRSINAAFPPKHAPMDWASVTHRASQPGRLPRQAANKSVSSRPMQDIHRIGQQ